MATHVRSTVNSTQIFIWYFARVLGINIHETLPRVMALLNLAEIALAWIASDACNARASAHLDVVNSVFCGHTHLDQPPHFIDWDYMPVTTPEKFPELKAHIGEDLIVTDGTTLLGADDKAGIAEIVQAMAYLLEHPEIKHGKVRVGFNPDEEIGLGAKAFDVEKFGCQWAYTMDGGELGELEYENFNAAAAKIDIKGVSVHPGYAKGKMINAAQVAAVLASEFPTHETPEHTAEYEGFYHLLHIEGNVEHASLSFIIRDHDSARFEERKAFVEKAVAWVNAKYGEGVATSTITEQYRNMRQQVEPMPHIIDIVLDAMREIDIEPKVRAIRGGTDGAQLSFMGLPCPNIFAGGLNFHGPHEFLPIPSLEKASRLVVKIIEMTARGI